MANRGEIAARIIRACRDLGIESVAVFSEADRDSPHLEEADRAVCIGPSQSKDSYLHMPALLQAAEQEGCQALHPGFGFLAENPLFASLCNQQQLTFIGPTPGAIMRMGDKALAKKTMSEAGLPVIPGSRGLLPSPEEALLLAEKIGYPILLKATAGGGGKGMRIVRTSSQLSECFIEAANEAEKAFGEAGLYMEKLIEGGRHIEFQILVDHFGNAVHLGERECSVQRNHQKLIEEAPSPALSSEERDATGEMVAEAVKQTGYRNAGTVEFLRDKNGQLYFMEMNTRLQVEHPVTEMITGVDIVREQIRIAANCRLSVSQDEIKITGHALECRINAEDPAQDFRPEPGCVSIFQPPPLIPGKLRVDTHVRSGYTIPPYYDSMICKVIARGDTREETVKSMLAALEEFRVEGVKTTIPLHREILRDPVFLSGDYDTSFIEKTGILRRLVAVS